MHEAAGSLDCVPPASLFTLIETGKGPLPGITVGVEQLSAASVTLIVTDAVPSAPRLSLTKRLTGKTPAVLKACDTLDSPTPAGKVSQVSGKVQTPVNESPTSTSEMAPRNSSVVPFAILVDAAGLDIAAVGAVFPEGGTSSSQTPRPCVATLSTEPSSRI